MRSLHYLLGVLLLLASPLGAHSQTPANATGQQVFATAGCIHCHGEAGLGTENAPSLRGIIKQATAAQMVEQITHGGQMMPPFGDILNEQQVLRVVEFLRSKDAWKGKSAGPESKYKAVPLPPPPAPASATPPTSQ